MVDARECQDPSAGATPGWSGLSHEVLTPLHAILGSVGLLLDGSTGPLSQPARACLGDVQEAARQLIGPVRTLLLLAQVQSYAMAPSDEPFDLIDLLRAAHAAARGADLVPLLQIVPGSPQLLLRGDPRCLAIMAATVVELPIAADRAATIHLQSELGVDGGTLTMTWPTFDPERLPPIQLALTTALLELNGGSLRAHASGGLRLCWPAARLA